MEMANYKWVAKSTFSAWRGSTQFVKGKTYTGIPYTMHNQTLSVAEYKSKIASNKTLYGSSTSSGTGPKYGSDCSGFVSGAWGISRRTTKTLCNVSTQIKYNDLQPGDIINKSGDHVVMFVKWANSSKTEMVIIEQTPPIAKEHTVKRSKYENDKKYIPLRWNKL